MNVITSRPIFSNNDGLNQGLNANEAERLRKKNERIANRDKNRKERESRLAKNKLDRQANISNRKNKRNAKRLLRLKNKNGITQIFYPLTRLRRNKENKIVKVQPDGSEIIIEPKNVVQVSTVELTNTGNVTKIVELDKTEIAEVLKLPFQTVTNLLLQEKKVEIPINLAPIQAEETKTAGLENVIAIEIKPEDVVTDSTGNDFVSTQTVAEDEIITDVTDNILPEKTKKIGLEIKVAIGVGAFAILGLVGYLIYNSYKNKK